MQNLSYGNEFDLHDNERARETHFNMKGYAATRKWLIFGIEKQQAWCLNCLPLLEGEETSLNGKSGHSVGHFTIN